MRQQTFHKVAGAIFAVIAVLHALRLIRGWDAVIGGWAVPHGISWVALFLFGALALAAFRLKG